MAVIGRVDERVKAPATAVELDYAVPSVGAAPRNIDHVTGRDALADELRPDRFTAISGKMAAIVGYILGEPLSEPMINDLVVTSESFVLAERYGEVGANEIIGTEEEVNLVSLTEAAGSSDDDVAEFGRLQRERIRPYSGRPG